MRVILMLPILIPFATAILCIFFWTRRRLQRTVSTIGAGALLVAAGTLLALIWKNGIQASQMGDWPAPFGITIVADLFSALMVVITGVMGLAVAVYSLGAMDPERESFGYYPLLHILLMGICGAFLTGDIFNLYVWFEVMLISSFVLIELGGEKAQLEGAIKYVTLNLISSALFLTAIAVLYGVAGTLNMADLAVQLAKFNRKEILSTVAVLFLLAFGIKAAVFPLFFWLPASYHTPPAPVSAIFAGLLTKVGVYSIIRVFTLFFVHEVGFTHKLILILAGFTMVCGVLGAVVQGDMRRLLAFHIVSQIGYMIMGLGLFTPLAIAGSILHLVHNMIVKSSLFMVSGVVHQLKGTYRLKKLGGLYATQPVLSILFLIPAFSLAGVPPLSGFWSKLVLIKAGLDIGQYGVVGIALIVGLFTLFSMTKIWGQAFWTGEADHHAGYRPGKNSSVTRFVLYAPIVILAAFTLTIGFYPKPFFALASKAAAQLIDPSEYIQAVLKGGSTWSLF